MWVEMELANQCFCNTQKIGETKPETFYVKKKLLDDRI